MKNFVLFIAILFGQLQSFAQCNYVWAQWRDQGQTDTAAGVINVNGAIVNIRMMANYNFNFTPDIYNYSSFAGYPDAPVNDTVPRLNWASGAAATSGVTTICFSPPVTDPVLLLSSVGSAWITVSLDFSSPYNVLYDGGGNIYHSNTTLEGHEGYCVLEFPGTISCITVFSTTPENFTNINWGVKNPLTADFTFTNNCQNNGIAFSSATSSINSPGTLTGFHWDFGDNSTSTLQNPLHNYSAPGIYNVQLVVTSNNLCSDTIYKSITVIPSYSTNQIISLCNGQSYTINSHTYSFNGIYYDTLVTGLGCDSIIVTDLRISSSLNILNPQTICEGGQYIFNSHIYSIAGNYFDTLSTVSGCDSIVNTQLTIMPYITSNNVQSLCPGESYLFNSHIYISAGPYYDTLQSGTGCDSIVITTIQIQSPPIITFSHPADICSDANPVLLNYASPPGGQYNGLGIMNNEFNPQTASIGTHQITYTYTDPATGCSNSAQENITVRPLPLAKLSVTPDRAQLPDSKISFIDMTQGTAISHWDFGDGSYSSDESGQHYYNDTGQFQITLMVTDIYGCTNITGITVFIDAAFSFYVPNAFTPNGDGMNDSFTGTGSGISTYEMKIFNSWGEEIFTTTDLNVPWKGHNAHDGTYVYKINLQDGHGEEHEYVGKVTVVR